MFQNNVSLLQSFLLILYFVYESKYYLQLFLDNCANKIVNTQMLDCLDDSVLEIDEDYF